MYIDYGGTHFRFDMELAKRQFAPLESTTRPLVGKHITSPWDLYSVEMLRDRHRVRQGKTFPSDLIVWGLGEPENLAATKVGGRPYWPKCEPWPISKKGEPYRFFAQMNFADSLELFEQELPANILTILLHPRHSLFGASNWMEFYWVSDQLEPNLAIDVPVVVENAGPFWATLHRSADYLEMVDQLNAIPADGSNNLPVANGSKISGCPHFIHGSGHWETTFLGQIATIHAARDVPYPWVNHESPIPEDFGSEATEARHEGFYIGDFGSFYFFMGQDGRVTRHWDTH